MKRDSYADKRARELKRSQKEEKVLQEEKLVEEVQPVQCREWCFLPGLGFIGPNGLLQCILAEGHTDEHTITINIFSPPSGKFKISWTAGIEDVLLGETD